MPRPRKADGCSWCRARRKVTGLTPRPLGACECEKDCRCEACALHWQTVVALAVLTVNFE